MRTVSAVENMMINGTVSIRLVNIPKFKWQHSRRKDGKAGRAVYATYVHTRLYTGLILTQARRGNPFKGEHQIAISRRLNYYDRHEVLGNAIVNALIFFPENGDDPNEYVEHVISMMEAAPPICPAGCCHQMLHSFRPEDGSPRYFGWRNREISSEVIRIPTLCPSSNTILYPTGRQVQYRSEREWGRIGECGGWH